MTRALGIAYLVCVSVMLIASTDTKPHVVNFSAWDTIGGIALFLFAAIAGAAIQRGDK